jgi:nicotinamidase-related amidase
MHVPRLDRSRTALIVIDVQERLLPVIHAPIELRRRIATAVRGARALDLPVIATEQYPKGLGHTAAAVAEALDGRAVIEKISFSCCGVDAFDRALAEHGSTTVLVAGIETHVCVLQTCLDLLERGSTPVLLADCVGSRHESDHLRAIERLRDAGAIVTTLESALFELTGRAGTDEFRSISGLVKPL